MPQRRCSRWGKSRIRQRTTKDRVWTMLPAHCSRVPRQLVVAPRSSALLRNPPRREPWSAAHSRRSSPAKRCWQPPHQCPQQLIVRRRRRPSVWETMSPLPRRPPPLRPILCSTCPDTRVLAPGPSMGGRSMRLCRSPRRHQAWARSWSKPPPSLRQRRTTRRLGRRVPRKLDWGQTTPTGECDRSDRRRYLGESSRQPGSSHRPTLHQQLDSSRPPTSLRPLDSSRPQISSRQPDSSRRPTSSRQPDSGHRQTSSRRPDSAHHRGKIRQLLGRVRSRGSEPVDHHKQDRQTLVSGHLPASQRPRRASAPRPPEGKPPGHTASNRTASNRTASNRTASGHRHRCSTPATMLRCWLRLVATPARSPS